MKIHPRFKTNTTKLFFSNSFFKILSFIFLPFFLHLMDKNEFSEFSIFLQIAILILVLCSCYKEFFIKSYFMSLQSKTSSLNLDFNLFLVVTSFLFIFAFLFIVIFQIDTLIFKHFNFAETNYKKIIIFLFIYLLVFDLILSPFLYNEQKIKNLFLYNLALFIIIHLLSVIFFFYLKILTKHI